MDETITDLAPPLGGLAAAIIFYLWARGAHRRARAKREAQLAE